MASKRNPDLAATLEEIQSRLARLEAAARAPAPVAADPAKFWLVDRIARVGTKGGEVAYGGTATLPSGEQFAWQRQVAAKDLLRHEWGGLDRVLAALGHPVRLRLLRAIVHGRRTKADLEQLEGLGTTGQLYHHLKTLEAAGWVRVLERGTYGVPGERVIPLLAILAAAAG
ncbi:MAG: helix-turn-helix domain-containing protein [Burkholderiales bacterium]|nr:helix-turn-helix domain-containing protein [Burkholderiales bacterium]MCL4687919.1 winged helix-turn-helix domain-containing protein [Burkholderiales bacterium]